MARRHEIFVVVPDGPRGHDCAPLGIRKDGSRRGRLLLHAPHDVALIEAVAQAHHVVPGRYQVDRRADGGSRPQGCCRPFLAEILQQDRSAERIAHRDHAIARQRVRQQGEHLPQVLAAAGVVMTAADGTGRPGAAQVEPQHPQAASKKQARHRADMQAGLRAGQAVDQDDQWSPRPRLRRVIEARQQGIAAAVGQGERQRFAAMRRHRARNAPQSIGESLEVGSPPGEAGFEGLEIERQGEAHAPSLSNPL